MKSLSLLKYLFVLLFSGLVCTTALVSCDSDTPEPFDKPGTEDPETPDDPGTPEDRFLQDSADKVTLEFVDPEEWIMGENVKPTLSYRLEVNEEIAGDLRLTLDACLPGEAEAVWSISEEFREPKKGTLEGQLVSETVPSPGFYVCKVSVNGKIVKTFNIACDPAKYYRKADYLPDFYEFWKKALADLDKVPMEAEMVLDKENSSQYFNVYEVKLNSAGDFTGDHVEIRGWYVEPAGRKNLAVQVMFCGLDEFGKNWPVPTATTRSDLALLNIFVRGQGPNRYDGRPNPYDYWFTSKMGIKDEYYYRGAYLDVARTVDFATTLENVDKNKIFVSGGSQGGSLAIAAAALRPDIVRICAAVFSINGDYPMYLKSVGSGWPNNRVLMVCREFGYEYDDVVRSLSYFDTKNLATMIKCPTIVQTTLQDPIAPAWCQLPIIHNLPSGTKSQWSISPAVGHMGTPEMTRELNDYIYENVLKE